MYYNCSMIDKVQIIRLTSFALWKKNRIPNVVLITLCSADPIILPRASLVLFPLISFTLVTLCSLSPFSFSSCHRPWQLVDIMDRLEHHPSYLFLFVFFLIIDAGKANISFTSTLVARLYGETLGSSN